MLQWLCFQSGGYPDKTVDVIYSCHSASSPPSPVSMLSTTDTPDVFFSCPLGSMRSTLKRGKGGLMTVKNKLRARYSEQLHLLGYRRQCTTNTPSRPPPPHLLQNNGPVYLVHPTRRSHAASRVRTKASQPPLCTTLHK